MYNEWREERILIWGKTYPELSQKYSETVCTGGTLENGDFIRIYPVPYRYLVEDGKFSKYQWIRAKIKKSEEDPRPESYKIDPETIVAEEKIPTDKFQWSERQRHVLASESSIFNSVESLFAENRLNNKSIGFVKPYKIHDVYLKERPEADYQTFLRKFKIAKEKSMQPELFGDLTVQEVQQLQFISKRFKVKWSSNVPDGIIHDMSILDWEVYELLRKVGEEETLERLKTYLLSGEYNIGFFLSNFRLHQNRFSIGGLWYPKKSNLAPNLKLF